MSRSFQCLKPREPEGWRCQKCTGCLTLRAWLKSLRIALEAYGHDGRCWLCTLTFRKEAQVDQYSEVQKWLKRVRKHVPSSTVRYVCVPEAGSRNNRLHYHLVVYCTDELKYRCLDHWHLGFANYKLVDPSAAGAYVAKYLAKGHGKVRASQRLGSDFVDTLHRKADPVLSAFPGARVIGFIPRGRRKAVRVPRELCPSPVVPVPQVRDPEVGEIFKSRSQEPSYKEFKKLSDIIHKMYNKHDE